MEELFVFFTMTQGLGAQVGWKPPVEKKILHFPSLPGTNPEYLALTKKKYIWLYSQVHFVIFPNTWTTHEGKLMSDNGNDSVFLFVFYGPTCPSVLLLSKNDEELVYAFFFFFLAAQVICCR